MKIKAKHAVHGTKDFSLSVWETIQAWPDLGGWQRVNTAPAEVAAPQTESEEPAPRTPKPARK